MVGQGRPWNPRRMSRVPAPQAPTGGSWAPSRLFGPRPPASPMSLRPCLSPAMDDWPEADSQRCQRSVGTAHGRPRELSSGRHDLRLSGDTFLPRPVVLARRDGFPLRTSVPEPPEGRHEAIQAHASDGPLKHHSRGSDPVTGCRPPQPGQRRWSSGLGGRAVEALRMDDGLSIGAVRPVEKRNGLLIGQRPHEAVTAVLRLMRT